MFSKNTNLKILDIIHIGLFTALIAICSWISIPTAIPFTLQTFAVFVSVGLLGLKKGTLSVLVYILLGAVGVPVFSGFAGGIGILFSSVGGYIIGFVFMALVTGLIIKHFGGKTPVMAFAMFIGLIVCYIFGTAWFMLFYTKSTGAVGLFTALSWCVFPYILPDLAKICLALFIIKRVQRSLKYKL